MDLTNVPTLMAAGLSAGSVWLAASRFRARLEANWPLIFYLGLVIYFNAYTNNIDPYVLYVSVVCGLLLRFEFLGRKLVLFVRFVELICLALIAFSLVTGLLKN